MTQTTTNEQQWHSSGISLGYDETLRRVVHLKTALEQFGITLHPQSRVSLFERRLRRLGERGIDQAIRDHNFDWTEFTEGNRDVMELSFILEKLMPLFPDEMKSALKGIISGAPLPSGDANTVARDIQFQLYVTARLAHSGFPLKLHEPDLVFAYEGSEYGIAAKRISSAKQLKRRIKEAVNQLEKAGLKGFIALSLDRMLLEKPGDPRIAAMDETSLGEAAPKLMEGLLKKHGRLIARLLIAPSVVGFLGHLVIQGVIQKPGNIGVTEALVLMPRGDDDPGSSSLVRSISSHLKSPALK
jgi:hypothetical protein